MKNKWANYGLGAGKVKSCYQREYINRKKVQKEIEPYKVAFTPMITNDEWVFRFKSTESNESIGEEIHRDDCGRLDDLAITQPVDSVEIIQPVQAVPRCKTKSGRQASNLATISKRPKNKPKIQKGVKKSTDGCNTGLD